MNRTTSVEACGKAFVAGIAARKRHVYVPGWVGARQRAAAQRCSTPALAERRGAPAHPEAAAAHGRGGTPARPVDQRPQRRAERRDRRPLTDDLVGRLLLRGQRPLHQAVGLVDRLGVALRSPALSALSASANFWSACCSSRSAATGQVLGVGLAPARLSVLSVGGRRRRRARRRRSSTSLERGRQRRADADVAAERRQHEPQHRVVAGRRPHAACRAAARRAARHRPAA